MTKRGLILEGGAMRGMFSAGVVDTMMKNNIVFDGVIGVSAGAAFGCNVKSHQIGRSVRYNVQQARNPAYCSFRSLIRTGDLYNGEFCYHTLPEKIDRFDKETYDSDPSEFWVVCTDVHTGKPVYHRIDRADYEAMEWIRASASMPLVSNVVHVGGCDLLDGGISDSIPVRYFESIGYDRNVVVLTRPEDYVKEPVHPLIPFLARKYPAIAEAMAHRHEVYNETLAYIREKEKSGELFVIRPPHPLPIGKIEHNAANMLEVYKTGIDTVTPFLKELREFLEQGGNTRHSSQTSV